jgi:hypothetical protein
MIVDHGVLSSGSAARNEHFFARHVALGAFANRTFPTVNGAPASPNKAGRTVLLNRCFNTCTRPTASAGLGHQSTQHSDRLMLIHDS